MGAWGVSIFADDLAVDIKDEYLALLAEFSRTRLKGLSFVDSDIRGIRVGDTGSFELKGLKVSALQASELARLLGLEIEG